MRLLSVPIVLAAVLAPALHATMQASSRWTELRTDNFIVIGDARDRALRRTAETLEQFREALTLLVPTATHRSPVPTVVVVFASDSSFAPFRPLFRGRPVELAGYFQAGEDVNYIAINAEYEASAIRAILHEYAHFITENTVGPAPVWVREGLATYYETFEMKDGGRGAVIGRPLAEHVALLRNSRLMPLTELMAVDHQSPVYNEGQRRGLFYAQSWALFHYLVLGNQERTPQLRAFLARVGAGQSADAALQEAFGVPASDLERELHDYVRRFSFPVLEATFSSRVAASVPQRGERMAEAEAEAYLGDLLARVGLVEEARARLTRWAEADPPNARTATALGLLDLREGRLEAALPLLQQAAALSPNDGAIQAALGRGLIEQMQRGQDAVDNPPRLAADARAVLTHALALEPERAHLYALLGYVEANDGGDVARGVELLEEAVRRSPAREQYRLMLAEALMRQGDHAAATSHLGMLVGHGSHPSIREQARTMLGRVAARRAAELEGTSAPDADDVRSLPDLADVSPRERTRTPTLILDLRPVGSGEVRVLGRFTEVQCTAEGIRFHIDTPEGVVRIAAQQFDDVDLVSFRTGAPSAVTCGTVAGAPRVLATYRPRAADTGPAPSAGDAIAIELIPDGYVP